MSKIYVVGIGPGEYEQMTMRAANALSSCDTIVGYTVYVDLVKAHFADKEFLTTPMRKEVDRCVLAFEEAKKGKTVAMICSGDAGVYGMSGLMLEIGVDYPEVEVEVIPGVTAATGGAAVLGAPLILASEADFVICLYNPSSHKRKDYLQKACDLMLQHKAPETVCGLVQNIGREGETYRILTLQELRDTQVDMFTTVFVVNSMTKEINGKMVTPRGYRHGKEE